MIYLDLPNINNGGTVEEQLSEIRSYIYRNNEQMNATLANLTTEKIWENTVNAVSSAQSENEAPQLLSKYAKIRDLIVKTATEITKTEEHYNMLLSGSYLAKSQFGEYLLNTSVEVNGNNTGFTELYGYATAFDNYKLDESMYIRRGLLDENSGDPIYGIELGILNKNLVVDGVEHSLDTAYRTRITPGRLSFLYNNSSNNDTEVAYIQADQIHFPNADIRGGSININNNFIVNSLGEMTATSGTFSGTLDVTSSNTYTSVKDTWNKVSNNKINLSSNALSFIDGGQTDFTLDPQGITFYKRNTVDDVMAEIKRSTLGAPVNGHWGLKIRLRRGYAEHFTIEEYDSQGDSDRQLVVVPNSGNLNVFPDGPYNDHGIYIKAKLHVWHSIKKQYLNTPVPTTIKLKASQIWGAVNDSDTDVYIDIVNGIITRISKSPN